MAQAWKTRRDEVLESAASVMAAIEHNESFSGRGRNQLSAGASWTRWSPRALEQFDPHNGGFGSQPKFPHPSALDLLLEVAREPRQARPRGRPSTVTLEKMARGGVYDQLAGGFHRYSVDERWVVPHFEKMLYDNTELLRNYVHAFQSVRRTGVRGRRARTSSRWMNDHAPTASAAASTPRRMPTSTSTTTATTSPGRGHEAAAVLTPEELDVAAAYYDIGDLGDMHHNPAKNVLHREAVAASKSRERLHREKIRCGARSRRRETEAAGRALAAPHAVHRQHGLHRLERHGRLRLSRGGAGAAHRLRAKLCAAHPGPAAPRGLGRERRAGPRDRLSRGRGARRGESRACSTITPCSRHACIDGWQATGELSYYEPPLHLADAMVARFLRPRTRRIFRHGAKKAADMLGALTPRRKPLQDSPTPAGNPTAAAALLRLEALSGRNDFREKAEDTLAAFAGVVSTSGSTRAATDWPSSGCCCRRCRW